MCIAYAFLEMCKILNNMFISSEKMSAKYDVECQWRLLSTEIEGNI